MKSKRSILIIFCLFILSIFVITKSLNITRSSFTVKSNSNVDISVADFKLDYKLLNGETEVTNLELNTDYILEIYNAEKIPCNFSISTAGTSYNTFSKYIKIFVEPFDENIDYCDYSNGIEGAYLSKDRDVLEVGNFKGVAEPLRFKIRLDTSYLTTNVNTVADKITDYNFTLKLKLSSYTI